MRDHFKPWRRKMGVVTLVIACVFMALWVRGISTCDVFDFGGRGGYLRLSASYHGLMWFWYEGDSNVRNGDAFQYDQHRLGKANDPQPADFHSGDNGQRELLWHRHWAGFHFSKLIWKADGMKITMWIIPHWSIVIPLTLLSAYLLLNKPRPKPRQQVSHA